MRVLVFGGGGREHALVWALRRSAGATEVFCAPGNAGIAALAECIEVNLSNVGAMLRVVERTRAELVVVGPEVPLAAGVVDALREMGLKVFGPTRAAAMLETSKAFAKDFMRRWEIPTAAYEVCRSTDEVRKALKGFREDVVVKADGLAAGKGVILCESQDEALAVAEAMFAGAAGMIAEKIVLEEQLIGPEISFFAICDGATAVTLAVAQDHKRVGEGDTGPNTGGMGAYSTDALISGEMRAWVLEHVAQRVVSGMKAEGTPFVGVLFIGLMMTPDGPRVLEFNTRFGDPETEAILLRLDSDLMTVLEAAVDGRIGEVAIRLREGASACVVLASGGYPGPYASGRVIDGLGNVPAEVQVFHAGTRAEGTEVLTAGGRVLAVSAMGRDLEEALKRCYGAIGCISFAGMQFRRDIGWRALQGDQGR